MIAMEVDALPIALVNGKRIHGALPAATYLQVVKQALRRAALAPERPGSAAGRTAGR
jgi:predicted DsbA family dithiol-disulfide isomerase